MPLTQSQQHIADMCIRELPLKEARLSNEYYYNSLVFCLIDAIFSIGVRYTSTANTVKNYCEYFTLDRIDFSRQNPSDTHTISDLIKNIGELEDKGASLIFKNSQKTSSKNGISKAQAVYQAALLLNKYNINSISDIRTYEDIKSLEKEFEKIKGQKSGISFSYLLMLSGDDNYMKIDRMLTRFVEVATNSKYSDIASINSDLQTVCTYLKSTGYPNLTPRLLDHEIWKYAKANLR